MNPIGDAAIKQPPPTKDTPIVWSVAGSDSGGGAGLQADLKVMNAFGVHGCSVVTALTAQNTLGIASIEPVSESMLRAQFDVLRTDLPPAAIKTGMLGNVQNCRILVDTLAAFSAPPPKLICDPVLQSTSGSALLDDSARKFLINDLFPKVSLLTPNLPETAALLGTAIQNVETAARQILTLGVASVLIKGGHAEGAECRDYWTDGTQAMWLASERIDTRATHGTGCILASAIASAMALGQTIPQAVITGKTFLNQCLKSPARVGSGQGPMKIEPFRNLPEDCPTIH